MFSIDSFRSKGLKYGGARPHLFDIFLTFPTGISTGIDSSWNAKSSFLPSVITTSTNVNYLGRNFKEPGERTYPQWTVTFINDEDFKLRNALEKWLDYTTGADKIGMTYPSGYNSDLSSLDGSTSQIDTGVSKVSSAIYGSAKAVQYSQNSKPIKAYNFVSIYPVTLTDIALSWDAANQIEEYSCTFDYQFFETSYDYINPDEGVNYSSNQYYARLTS